MLFSLTISFSVRIKPFFESLLLACAACCAMEAEQIDFSRVHTYLLSHPLQTNGDLNLAKHISSSNSSHISHQIPQLRQYLVVFLEHLSPHTFCFLHLLLCKHGLYTAPNLLYFSALTYFWISLDIDVLFRPIASPIFPRLLFLVSRFSISNLSSYVIYLNMVSFTFLAYGFGYPCDITERQLCS